MARIFPFRPYRYSAKAGDLNALATQPYDKITPEAQKSYLARSPYNLARIILGERFPTDTETHNVYTRAAALLNEWMRDGILEQEPEPCFFAYVQEFTVPDSGQTLARKGFIGLGEVVPYSAGIVHRHEQTLTGPKRDRMELMRHTRCFFEQLFMLYPDPSGAIDAILDAHTQQAPLASVTDDYGAVHSIWRIADPAVIATLQHLMADKKLLIADGHHRYETAVAFREQHPELEDASRVTMTFVNMHSPGLRILATHRLISGLEGFDAARFLEKAKARFRVSPLDSLNALKARWDEPHEGLIRIGVAIHGHAGLWLMECDRRPLQLDVTTLHEGLIRECLGISDEAVREERYLKYIRGVEVAVDAVRAGEAQIGFLVEATTVQQVADISFSGGVMPQKSTDFYPKLLSGLTAYRLEK